MPSAFTEDVSAHKMNADEIDGSFAFIRGGLIYRLEERLGLITADNWRLVRRISAAIAITCLPLIILSFAAGDSGSGIQLLKDYRISARFVIALSFLVIAQPSIALRLHSAIRQFSSTRIIGESDLPKFQQILASTKTLAESVVPESVALVLILALAPFIQRSRFLPVGSWGMQAVAGSSPVVTAARWYFLLVSEPVYLMMLTVILWKWIVWVIFLWRVSRLDLQLTFAHPDRCGGLGFLGLVPEGYMGAVFGVCAAVGAMWRFNVANHFATMQSLYLPGVGLLVGILLLLFGPLAFFSTQLIELRRVGLLQYGALAHLHSVHFGRKWITNLSSNEPELLSVPEVTTLYDLGGEFRLMMDTKVVPISRAPLLDMTAVVLAPMVPVLLTEIPLITLLKVVLRALL